MFQFLSVKTFELSHTASFAASQNTIFVANY